MLVARLGAFVRTRSPTGEYRAVSVFFPICPKLAQHVKSKWMPYLANRNKVKNPGQLFKLCGLQIPNRNKIKNPGIDSIFESLMNFKRDSNLLQKSDKFSKIPS
jgi:hypothetical protein